MSAKEPDLSKLPAGISLCMIVKDEARFLEKALRSAAGSVDEIIIIDTGSTDKTVEIARRFGARVESRTWREDFSWARNEALALATRRWILVLDADEVLDAESRTPLRQMASAQVKLRGLWVQCKNVRDERTPEIPSHVNAIVRVFPNNPRVRYRNAIHEVLVLDGDQPLLAEQSPISITHFGYTDEMMAGRAKAERNYRLSLAETTKNANDAFAHYNLAMAAMFLGRKDEALASLETMRRLAAGERFAYLPPGLAVLADFYLERGDAARAFAACDEALKIAPKFPNALYTRGNILSALGRSQDARDAFGAAYESAGAAMHSTCDMEIRTWKAANAIGASLVVEERFGEARAWFELAIEGGEGVSLVHLNRARVLERLEHTDSAAAAFELAFRRFANEECTVEFVNFLLRHNQTDRALEAIDTATSFLEDSVKITLLGSAAAVVIRREGAEARAIGYMKRALAIGMSLEETEAHLEELFMRFGDGTALALLRRVAAEVRAGQRSGLRLNAAFA